MWTNITTNAGETTHIVNRIKSLTVPCSSGLMRMFSYGWERLLLLLLSPWCMHGLFGDGRLPYWLEFLRPFRLTWVAKHEAVPLTSWLPFIGRLTRLTWIAKREAVRLPSRLQLFDRELDLRKIFIRHHTAKYYWERNRNLPHSTFF